MSYLNKLESEEVDILMEHSNGMKCWQTDYKILRTDKNQQALANFDEEIAFREAFESDKAVEQIPLF